MKKAYKKGFTLIEVLLFVAITTALFVGVASGTYGSIYQQRFMDSLQNFAEFLKSVYSEATNTQFDSGRRTLNQALYGKVVTFETDQQTGANVITMYSLIGDADKRGCTSTNMPNAKLGCLKANVMMAEVDSVTHLTDLSKVRTVGYVKDYTVRWDARIQTNDGWNAGWDASLGGDGFSNYEGIIMVTRSPDSGNLFTYVLDKTVNGNNEMLSSGVIKNQAVDMIMNGIKTLCGNAGNFNYAGSTKVCATDASGLKNPFAYQTNDPDNPVAYYFGDFKQKTVEFCVNPNGDDKADLRRNVRIIVGAHNATGVEVAKDELPPGATEAGFDWSAYESEDEYNYKNENNYNLCKQ